MPKFTPGPWGLVDIPGQGLLIKASVQIGLSRPKQEEAAQKGENIQEIYHVPIKPQLTVNDDGSVTAQISYEGWRQFPSLDFQEMQLANAHLIAAAPDMYEALEDLLILLRWRGDGPLEALENMCERFYRDTGIMAPGKDVPPAMAEHSIEERTKAWEQWALVKVDKARTVLAKARGESP